MHVVILSESLSSLTENNALTFVGCLAECDIFNCLVSDLGDMLIEVKQEREEKVLDLLDEFRLDWIEVFVKAFNKPNPVLN